MSPNPARATPRVSVVMPVYNGESFLAGAVESILNQSMADLELIVVDDASTDGSSRILAGIDDPRLRLHRLERNSGISRALNTGISLARAGYIARMDADDESAPTRLERQVEHLEANPEVGAVGTVPILMDQDGGNRRPYPVMIRDVDLRRLLLLQGPFCHGSVMFRRTVFDSVGPYRSEEEPAEDYALWLRMAQVTQLANVPDALYSLRVGDHSVSARNARAQLTKRDEIRRDARRALGHPRLTWRVLSDGRRHYQRLPTPLSPLLVQGFIRQHQELAALDLAERGVVAIPNVVRAAALSPRSLRTPVRMWRYYRVSRQPRAT